MNSNNQLIYLQFCINFRKIPGIQKNEEISFKMVCQKIAEYFKEMPRIVWGKLRSGSLGVMNVAFSTAWTKEQCGDHLLTVYPLLQNCSGYTICRAMSGGGNHLEPIEVDGLELEYVYVSKFSPNKFKIE